MWYGWWLRPGTGLASHACMNACMRASARVLFCERRDPACMYLRPIATRRCGVHGVAAVGPRLHAHTISLAGGAVRGRVGHCPAPPPPLKPPTHFGSAALCAQPSAPPPACLLPVGRRLARAVHAWRARFCEGGGDSVGISPPFSHSVASESAAVCCVRVCPTHGAQIALRGMAPGENG